MRVRLVLVFTTATLLIAGAVHAQTPPEAPPITSPLSGQVVNPFDVHMEAGPFSDPDPGDTHQCTDWEIWTVSPLERVWVTSCIGDVERLHTHLGDGTYENSHAGRTSLFYDTPYKLRVRFRDQTGLWSLFSELPFSTGSQVQVFPLLTNDVIGGVTWTNELGSPIVLIPGSPPPFLRLESGVGAALLLISGNDGVTNTVTNPDALPADVAVRVIVDGGGSGVLFPPTRVAFTDPLGIFHSVYLPTLNLPTGAQAVFWVASDGSTYVGSSGQTTPDFSLLARASPVPWTVFRPGFEVEVIATGFQLPVNIAFVPAPGPNPDDPYFYVTELYGTIKVISRNGAVSNYATNLLNFNPTGNFPGSGEQGVSGIVVDPASGDVFACMLYDDAPPDGPHYPKIVRFHSNDGGRTAATQTTILSMPGEPMGQSHFISNITIGPSDGKLYVHVGDGFQASSALNLDSFRGKIIRLNFNGSAPSDNPFYNAGNGINARDYVFAYGFRNPFGGCWRASDGVHYQLENGNATNDRLSRVLSGTSYGWNGTDASMTTNAIYNWNPTVGPVNIAFVQPQTFGGSGFPASMQDRAFVTLSGSTYFEGPSSEKAIQEFILSSTGTLISGPNQIIQYNGTGRATAVGLAAGQDGLYFTDLYRDHGATSPIDPGANVLRLKYRGVVNFSSSAQSGTSPLFVSLTDLSDVPGAFAWFWDFGDGTTSDVRNPMHLFAANGTYDVRLTVTGANGSVVAEKNDYIAVGVPQPGILGTYFQGMDLATPILSRVDAGVDFDWGNGSPAPQVPSDTFSVRWVGEVQAPQTQAFEFFTLADDGVRLWVNNQLLIDEWWPQRATEHSGGISLQAGVWYPIRMEYFEQNGQAEARLSWQYSGQSKQIIPAARLRATGPAPVTSVDPSPPTVQAVTLLPAAPQPVSSRSELGFALPETGHATLRLYNVHGALVATLFDGVAEGQRVHRIPLDRKRLAGGVYFQRLEAGGVRLHRKLVLLP